MGFDPPRPGRPRDGADPNRFGPANGNALGRPASTARTMPFADLPDPLAADLERLRADWDEVPVATQRYESPADAYDPDAVVDPAFRYASAWVRRDGEALLVQPVDDDGWTNPGGTHEPGERYEETAIRETREEVGIEFDLRGVLEAIVTRHAFGDRAVEWALGVVFDARYAGGEIERQPAEIDAVRWAEELPDEADLVFERTADYPL
jgi:ADP-ribose pyrophosphatase YjhB (NUDIX family)